LYSLGVPGGFTQLPLQQNVSLLPTQLDPSAPVQLPQLPPVVVQAWQVPPHSVKSPALRFWQLPATQDVHTETQPFPSAAVMPEHTPVPEAAQLWQVPHDGVVQQTPSTQFPDTHVEPLPQLIPKSSLQLPLPSHVLFPLQVPGAVLSSTYAL